MVKRVHQAVRSGIFGGRIKMMKLNIYSCWIDEKRCRTEAL